MENPTRILVGPVRLSYPHLFKPQEIQGSDSKKYSVSLLIPKENTKLIDAVKTAISAAIPPEALKGGKLPKNYRNPLRDGDADKEEDENYKGMAFISANTTTKPQVVKKVNGVFVQCEEAEVYPGCWAYVNINFYAYSKTGNSGIAAGLNGVCKYKDDESFGGSTQSAEQMFGGAPESVQQAAAPASDGWGGGQMPFPEAEAESEF